MISTTTGEVRFEAGKRQYFPRRGRVRGSIFTGTIRMTRSELAEASEKFRMLIPPPGVFTSFNGERLPLREPVASFETTLPTLISDEDGNLRRTARKTRVDIHEVRDGEEAHIYEMGIPVVPTSDKYHVDVQQKVPVTMDRTNVPPSYLRKIRAEVLNHTHDILTKKDASETWVTDAMGHGDITVGAVEKVMVQRFGRKRAIYDPSDQEANNRLAAKGYKIIHGGTFGKGVWEKIREAGAAKPSGAIAPTPKPFDPKGDPADVVPPEKWSEGMRYAEMLARELAECLLGESIHVDFINHPNPSWQAAYGSGHLSFFMKGTGRKFFDRWRVHDEDLKRLLGLLIHEFAHHHEKNHLSDGYAKAVERLGAQLSVLLMRSPNIVKKYLEA